jgi:hypothetical protein
MKGYSTAIDVRPASKFEILAHSCCMGADSIGLGTCSQLELITCHMEAKPTDLRNTSSADIYMYLMLANSASASAHKLQYRKID